MSWDEIIKVMPALDREGRVTSPCDIFYNCIAWAVHDDQEWWEPVAQGGNYWPPGVTMSYAVSSYIAAYATRGYTPCSSGAMEAGFEKIAIYANADGDVTHAARQLSNGRWTSKLGTEFDIEHEFTHSVEGDTYGKVVVFVKRPN